MGDRIKQVMGSMTQGEFAEKIGVTTQAVNQWLSGTTKPGKKSLETIASKFSVDLNWLMAGDGLIFLHDEQNKPSDDAQPAFLKEQFSAPPIFLGQRDLPVYAAVEGGPGELVVTTDPIDLVPRPWYLGEVKDGYAVLVTGDSMSPIYDPGDMIIINPRLPFMRGKDHIFATERDDGHFKAMVKRLVSSNSQEWQVEQFNPSKVFKLQRAEWTTARRVVGKYNA